LRVGAEHDDDALQLVRRVHRGDRMLQQRTAVQFRELLRGAEPSSRTRGQDRAGDQAPTS
jgi:hypothetical protein